MSDLGSSSDGDDGVPLNLEVLDQNLSAEARAERLRDAVRKAGGPKVVAARIGIHPNTFTRYFQGRDVQSAVLVVIADACGVSVEWLATGRGEPHSGWITERHPAALPMGDQGDRMEVSAGPLMPVTSPSAQSRYVPVPRLNVAASAGGGALAEHPQVVEYIAFEETFLRDHLHRRAGELLLIEATGDSMEPTIRDGDILTIDIRQDQPIRNGRLYVLQVGEGLLVKRVEQRLQSLVLHSDNGRYSPETIVAAEADRLRVVGEVILVTAPPR